MARPSSFPGSEGGLLRVTVPGSSGHRVCALCCGGFVGALGFPSQDHSQLGVSLGSLWERQEQLEGVFWVGPWNGTHLSIRLTVEASSLSAGVGGHPQTPLSGQLDGRDR